MKKFFLSALPAALAIAMLVAVAPGCAPQNTSHVHMPSKDEIQSQADKEADEHHDAAEKSSEKTIAILEGRFDPPELTIKGGDTVIWVNEDSEPHEVHANDDAFKSPTLETGDSFSQKISAAGEIGYHDHFHEAVKGTIVAE